MAIDPSIALGVQQYKAPDQMNMLAQVLNIQNAQGQNQLAQYNLGKAKRQDEESNAIAGLLRGGTDVNTPEGQAQLYGVAPLSAAGLIKQQLENRNITSQIGERDAKAKADTYKRAQDGYNVFRQTVGAHINNPNATPQDIAGAVGNIVQAGLMDGNVAKGLLQGMPQDPQALRGYLRQIVTSQMTPEQMMTVFAPKPTEVNNGQQKGFRDTNPNSPTYGQATAGAPVQMQMTPGEVATDRRAGAQLAQSERHFQAEQSAPQYMMTDAGLVALPKRPAQGQAPSGAPVMGPDGQPLGKPLKDIPPAQNTALIENTKAIQNIDAAIQAIKSNPDALGAKNYLGDGIRQRTDPEGVSVRAQVANIGGQKYHDISGAAVSVGEAKRLQPFIPTDTDKPGAAIQKLMNLRREYESVNDMMGQTYSKEQGYRPSPVKPKAGVVDLHTLPSGGGKVVDFGSLR